jgi:hypothetical protein
LDGAGWFVSGMNNSPPPAFWSMVIVHYVCQRISREEAEFCEFANAIISCLVQGGGDFTPISVDTASHIT